MRLAPGSKSRLISLDYLRGICVFGVMTYHYSCWSIGVPSPDTFLGRFGLYGVSLFYILSGLTLYHVYYKRMVPDRDDLKDFFLKRFFRIFPLLWLITFLTILLDKQYPGTKKLILNLTGLFSILRPNAYIGTGVWSIGNELAFYLLFPLFILTSKWRNRMVFYALIAAILGAYLYFAFFRIKSTVPLSNETQWTLYINPLNQAFLFLGGYLIGYFLHDKHISPLVSAICVVLAISVFIWYPVRHGLIVTGINRIIFTCCALITCAVFYKNNLQLPSVFNALFARLGEASYSVYLIHPIIWVCLALLHLPTVLQLPLSLVTTLLVSYFCYSYFEIFFMKWGRTISDRIKVSLSSGRIIEYMRMGQGDKL